MTVTASPQDNYKRTRSHYFSRCFHYLVVWTVAIGRGGYFGLNMFVLLFGGFFGKLTGGVALSIQATLGILSTVGFLGIFSSKEYFNQAKFDLQKAELAQLEHRFRLRPTTGTHHRDLNASLRYLSRAFFLSLSLSHSHSRTRNLSLESRQLSTK